ncbi:antibiotic biosynthesis monooxygenase [Streptomyces sp. SJ1-7]|nr:antibiotic biosynthesis monooxygenase [Streptomyces sp. SJ1-7]
MATQSAKRPGTLQALPGREDDVRDFLIRGCQSLRGARDGRWFGIQFDPRRSDLRRFPDDDGAKHTCRARRAGLSQKSGELFEEPTIELIDVVARSSPLKTP